MKIISNPSNEKYRKGWDKIFGNDVDKHNKKIKDIEERAAKAVCDAIYKPKKKGKK